MDIFDGQSRAGWVYLGGHRALHGGRDGKCSGGGGGGTTPLKPFGCTRRKYGFLADPMCTGEIRVLALRYLDATDTVEQSLGDHEARVRARGGNDLSVWHLQHYPMRVVANEGLFPKDAAVDIEGMETYLEDDLIGPVERGGMEYLRNGRKPLPAILDSWRKAFATLDKLEGRLGNTRFLTGNNATGADICLASFVFCLNACYWKLFGLRHAPGYWGSILSVGGDAHYLNLRAFSREMYQLMETALDIASFKQNFRLVHAVEFACLPCSCKILSSHVRISHGIDIIARLVEAEVKKRWGEDPILTTTT